MFPFVEWLSFMVFFWSSLIASAESYMISSSVLHVFYFLLIKFIVLSFFFLVGIVLSFFDCKISNTYFYLITIYLICFYLA